MEAAGSRSPAPVERGSLLPYDEVLALTLIIDRGLSYRELAGRMGRPEREILLLITDALRRASARRRADDAVLPAVDAQPDGPRPAQPVG